MKKRIAAGVLALVLALGMTPIPTNFVQDTVMTASAHGVADETQPTKYMDGDFVFIINDDGTAVIVGYYGSDEVLNIPTELTATLVGVEYPPKTQKCVVTGLGNGEPVFGINNTTLKEIILPDTIKSIGESAFYGCSKLDKINFGKSVTSIGFQAFYGCTSLTSITIPKTVTDMGKSLFNNCTNLKTVIFEEGIKSIGEYSLYHLEGLTNVTIPDSITSIGFSAFSGCKNLTSITFGKNLTEIGDWSFEGCEALKSITIPDSVTRIGLAAFEDCSSLESVTFGKGLKTIEQQAFGNCVNLKKVTIPKTVETISGSDLGMVMKQAADGTYYSEQIEGFKLYCYSGTDAEQYAKSHGLDYELLDKKPDGGNNNPSGGNNNNPGGGNETANISTPGLQKFSASENAARINWNKVEGADGYRVYKYENGKWKTIKTINNGDTTTYRDSGLKAGTTYKYKVKAFVRDSAGKAVWGGASATITTATKPSKPTITKASKSKTAVRLYWNKVSGASGYKLQQYDSKTKTWKTVKTLNASADNYKVTSLKAHTAYKFRIQAYKKAGSQKSYSDWSATKKATTK